MVKPLEELANDQNPAKYRPYSWGNIWLVIDASSEGAKEFLHLAMHSKWVQNEFCTWAGKKTVQYTIDMTRYD
ncbi:hypothetical protein LguiB_022181 [Lonicera macranthoides]